VQIRDEMISVQPAHPTSSEERERLKFPAALRQKTCQTEVALGQLQTTLLASTP
jgi:hypothetical protein